MAKWVYVRYGSLADIRATLLSCPLVTQSRHAPLVRLHVRFQGKSGRGEFNEYTP